MGLEFRIRRLYRQSKVAPTWLVNQADLQGIFTLKEEEDPVRRRRVKVARVQTQSSKDDPPPLYDAVVLEASPEWWSVTGIERVLDGPLCEEHCYAQSWVLIPTFTDELIAAERRIDELTAELAALRLKWEQLSTPSPGLSRQSAPELRLGPAHPLP